jgi:hypothetical protein
MLFQTDRRNHLGVVAIGTLAAVVVVTSALTGVAAGNAAATGVIML